MAKPALGFPTIKALEQAVKEIVNQYPVNVEFFHPLLQKLFIERPYWCDPPGFTFTKFKWILYELPNGATTERWFTAFSPETGWRGPSWKKSVHGKKITLEDKLREFARWRSSPIVSIYLKEH